MSDGSGHPHNSQTDSSEIRTRVESSVGSGDIFDLHREVVGDYWASIESFINIADDGIRAVVQQALASGQPWPEPLLQLNPAFEEAGTVESLVHAGQLHSDCSSIFSGYRLYLHQKRAIELGLAGKDIVVTSGTGSGKSLTYIGTIFDELLRAGPTMTARHATRRSSLNLARKAGARHL